MTVADVEQLPVAAPAEAEAPEAPAPSAPTWSAIFAAYLGPGTSGSCGRSSACHATEMSDPSAAYRWLSERGYIDGPRSALVSRTNSCLKWFGGNMPPRGEPSEDAARDLRAWATAGAQEN
jgi:hypothetical protein